ncbi:MAG: bifunctional UDP-sugar hydrolase/5'-nucleotidase, partial [Candidatus Neomarinimicrobiota bacterium]
MQKILNKICILLLLAATAFAADFPAEEFQRITVIFTNDVHGGITRTEATFMNPQFPPQIGSAPALAHYVKQLRQKAEKEDFGVLVIDQGDFFSGTPVGSTTAGKAVVAMMNRVGYDAMVMGNHDFDKGLTELRTRADEADFPFLGANIVTESGAVAEFLEPYVIKEIAGIKIGILGIATSVTPSMSFPEHVKGLTFRPEILTAREWVPRMKEAGADIIIASTHTWTPYEREQAAAELHEKLKKGVWPDPNKIGVEGMEIAVSVPDIDIMYTGHVHKGFNEPYEDPVNHTLIFQNYANGTNVGQVNFYIHKATKTLAGYDFAVDGSAIITLLEDEFWIDTAVDSLIEAYRAVAEAGFDEVLTVLPAPLRRANEGQSGVGNLFMDALARAVNADIAFSNFGGLRSDLEAGPLTYEDLFRFEPFGNQITVFRMTGAQIHALIEDRVKGNSRGMLVSDGSEIIVDKTRPDGNRVTIKKIGGKDYDPDAVYKLAVSDYLA